jgi:uncharacterized repeat protein (TIGR01451 family)
MDATDVELLEIIGSGTITGQAYLDLDASGTPNAADSVLEDVRITLLTASTSEIVLEETTDSLGVFEFLDVPVGTYRIALDPAVLGDSLTAFGADTPLPVEPDSTTVVTIGATFAVLALEDVLTAPAGRRVFTSGIALNPRVNFGDGQVHFSGATAFLRGLNVARGALDPGDSARVLGHVVSDNGRPALRDVTYFVLQPSAQPVLPIELSTVAAATASSGANDAALARIRRAEITDTSTVNGHFRFWADDGTDSVEFMIRSFLVPSVNTSAFRPDTTIRIQQATGLLSPFDDGSGTIRWRFLPRAGTDIVLETKLADLSVTTAFDTAQASTGDTVRITVTVANAGPLAATAARVRDIIPTGLLFRSATSTAGTYDSGTGIWSFASLAVGANDTLRIDVEVTAVPPTTITNVVQALAPAREVDPVGLNNSASASVTIIP